METRMKRNGQKYRLLRKREASVFGFDDNGDIVERYDGIDAGKASPLVTAYIGDAYYHLFVRKRMLSYEQSRVEILHGFCARIVSAPWQARAYERIEGSLTDEERDLFRRGRNAHSHAPRAATFKEYHMSTGFESVLGTLYLTGRLQRLDEICEASFQAVVHDMMSEEK